MNGLPNAQQKAERATQKRQQNQRYIDYNLRGLKPKYLQLNAQLQLMEYPNANWIDFSPHNIQEDVMIQVSSNFLHDVEQIKTELATLGQEMRNLRIKHREHRVFAMEENSRARALNQKQKQKTVQFCNYLHENGHTAKWCREKCGTERYKKYDMKCSLQGITFLPGTMAIKLSTAPPNTMKTSTNLLIRMIATTQLMNINLRKKKPGQMNLTKSLHLNQDTF